MEKTKFCPQCNRNKLLTEFYVSKSSPNGSTLCKECRIRKYKKTYDPIKSKQHRDAFRQQINEAKRKRYAKHKKENLSWLVAYLGADKIRCERCKYDKCFKAIHLHHLNKDEKNGKSDQLSNWLNHYSLEKFQKKILTTNFSLLCANCHIELHAGVWEL